MNMKLRFLSLIILPFAFMACDTNDVTTEPANGNQVQHDQLIAVMHPTEGNEAQGIITFTREGDGVRVQGTISGLDANSRHGFHIHEFGDCSADDGTSAGDHFAPEEMPHGAPTDEERHMGDMGNVETNEDGEAQINYVDPMMEIEGENTILGRGVIVHAEEDDLQTQPTGDAGGRLGCGVIGVAQPQ